MTDSGNPSEVTLLKDSQWSIIDGEFCRVTDFIPMSSVKDGKIKTLGMAPYGTVILECRKLPTKTRGFICHKVDFMHLWIAFKERTIKQNEEVIIAWSKRHYKLYAKIFSAFMPRLWVMICPKGAFELLVDRNFKLELTGEARYKATAPIIDWKPEVME